MSESETAEEDALEEASVDALEDSVAADELVEDAEAEAEDDDDPPPHAVSMRVAKTMHETSAAAMILVRFTSTPLCRF